MMGGWTRWLNLFVLLGFGWVAILLELAPLREAAGRTPSPDLLFCVCVYLALRRPAATPASAILLLGLARDLIGGGAPAGLGALSLLAAVEALRALRARLRRRAAFYEFAAVSFAAAAMIGAQIALLALTFAPTPSLDVMLLRLLATALAYVLVFALFRVALRIGYDGAGARLSRRAP